jgi:Taurine catabolism dioxygenase TauD, TfdA family
MPLQAMSNLLGHEGYLLPVLSHVLQPARSLVLTATGADATCSSSSKAMRWVMLLFFLGSIDISSKRSKSRCLIKDEDRSYARANCTSSSFKATHDYPAHYPRDPAPLFRFNPDALKDMSPIPFQEAWINDFDIAPPNPGPNHAWPVPESPKELPVPHHYVQVFDLSLPTTHSLRDMGRQARQLIDRHLDHGSGAMLFRNLHHMIPNASEFATFWNHVVQSNGSHNGNTSTSNKWNIMSDHLSCYNRKRQRLYDQIDRADTDVPSVTIGPHNEHSCNPYVSDRIFFYALHTAARGGESLLRRNSDMQIPAQAWKILLHQNNNIYTAKLGGALVFTRSYPHAATLAAMPPEHRHPTEMSWQERCQTNSTASAKRYFEQHHGITNVTFDEIDGTLTAHNLLPGYYYQHHNNHKNHSAVTPVWFNRIDYGFPVTLANGTTFPLDLQAYLKRQKWHETFALKLQQGDWMVLDNRRVQHGRLPYSDEDNDGDDDDNPRQGVKPPPRQLLVTYTTAT